MFFQDTSQLSCAACGTMFSENFIPNIQSLRLNSDQRFSQQDKSYSGVYVCIMLLLKVNKHSVCVVAQEEEEPGRKRRVVLQRAVFLNG